MHRRLVLASLIAAPLLLALPAAAQERIKAVTSFTILADMAANVASEAADVVSITKPGGEIHNYQPTPGDLVAAQDADLILWNGLNLEQWFARFLDNLPAAPSVVLSMKSSRSALALARWARRRGGKSNTPRRTDAAGRVAGLICPSGR